MGPAEHIAEMFGEDKSLYEILGVAETASPGEIKKAYYKQARLCHPDKCPNDAGAHSRFQALSMVHQVLSDEEQRKLYDDTGEFGDGDAEMNEKDFDQWYEYYRNLFPKVTESKITEFAAQYRESDEEKRDVLAAYSSEGGGFRAGRKKRPMQSVIDSVMLSSEDDVDRFAAIIEQAIECGEVERYPAFTKFQRARLASTSNGGGETNAKEAKAAKKRKAKAMKEAKEAEEMAEILRAKRRRPSSGAEVDRELTTHRQREFSDLVKGIEDRYGGKGKGKDKGHKGAKKGSKGGKRGGVVAAGSPDPLEIDDAEFERIRATLGKR